MCIYIDYIQLIDISFRNYMDYCQEQLSEFRKQKVELNKESKSL